MNYEKVAKKISDDIVDPDPLHEIHRRLKVAVAAALRRAANEAASAILDDLDKCWSFDNDQQHTHTWHTKQDFMQRHRPEGGTP